MKKFYDKFNLWLPSPLQKINYSKYPGYDIYVKRDDLIHHDISGNKFRKLKYNLIEFYKTNKKSIIAFGGAFSNLLHTLSVISSEMNIPATFYIRGEYDPANPTLKSIKQNGVKMIFMSRTAFKSIRKQEFLDDLQQKFPDSYIIPEGGSNNFAVPGSGEIVEEIISELGEAPDYLVMDLGTGGTFAGVLDKIPPETWLIGISAIKGVDWNRTLTDIFNGDNSFLERSNWEILEDYHFNGFARYNMDLVNFINKYKRKYGIPLEPIYSGKMVYALHDLLEKGFFKPASKIVWVHGGGLQGIKGFNYLNGNLLI